MNICMDCGRQTNTYYSGCGPLCDECRDKRDQQRILDKTETITKCSDFKEWSGRDLSELFWIHFARYQREPNADSWMWMEMALRWACHADHGLSNCFYHAFKWAGIDVLTEDLRWRSK